MQGQRIDVFYYQVFIGTRDTTPLGSLMNADIRIIQPKHQMAPREYIKSNDTAIMSEVLGECQKMFLHPETSYPF